MPVRRKFMTFEVYKRLFLRFLKEENITGLFFYEYNKSKSRDSQPYDDFNTFLKKYYDLYIQSASLFSTPISGAFVWFGSKNGVNFWEILSTRFMNVLRMVHYEINKENEEE